MIKNKKGELTSQQIVILIILIASFAVLLFFLFKLNFGKTSNEEICHNSVITRGSGVLPKESIPLDCKTNYICITKDGSCEKMTGNRETRKAKTQDETYKILAEEMADCWWIFGEGKINYIGTDFKSSLYCSICSQISFDNSIDFFEEGEIDQKLFYDYLAKTNYSEDTSYLDYLVGLKSSQTIEDSLKAGNFESGKPINLGRQYYIIMGIFSETGLTKWAGSGVVIGAVVGGIVGGPIGIVIGGAIGGGGGYFMGTVVKGESGHEYISPAIIEANSEDFSKLKCASIKTLA